MTIDSYQDELEMCWEFGELQCLHWTPVLYVLDNVHIVLSFHVSSTALHSTAMEQCTAVLCTA